MKTSSSDGVVGRAEWTVRPAARSSAPSASAARAASAREASRSVACSRCPEAQDLADAAGSARSSSRAFAARLGHELDQDTRLGLAQRVGSVDGQDAPVVDERHARAALGLVEVGRREQDREPVALQPRQEPPEVAPRDGVDAGRRLVEHQQLRRVHERARERELLLHAAREARREPVAERRHAHAARAARRACRRVVAHVVDLGEERDVLVDAEVAVEREALRQVADPARRARAARACGSRPQVVTRAGVGLEQAEHHAQRGRLAGAVRADQAEHLAAAGPRSERRRPPRPRRSGARGLPTRISGRAAAAPLPQPRLARASRA